MELIYTLAHYFYPRYSNNHKAKILHSSSILLLTVFLVFYQVILVTFPLSGVSVLGYAANIAPDEVIKLTNLKRTEAGVPSLTFNVSLTEAARRKGEHMLAFDYWAHTAPDGTEPWKFFVDVGYKYRYAGENLARDFSNSQSAIDAWMASPSHRENILSTKYKEIGIAVVEGDLGGVDTTIIVSLFGTQLADTTAQIPVAAAQPVVTNIPTPSESLTTTPIPTAAEQIVTTSQPTQEKAGGLGILISPLETTRGISIAITGLLLIVLVIDGIVIARRNIKRVGGRTFAHLAFLGMVLAIILIARAGEIL